MLHCYMGTLICGGSCDPQHTEKKKEKETSVLPLCIYLHHVHAIELESRHSRSCHTWETGLPRDGIHIPPEIQIKLSSYIPAVCTVDRATVPGLRFVVRVFAVLGAAAALVGVGFCGWLWAVALCFMAI